ncbi:DUF2267 domain-containing protein [bacterium]|nr:DUF2267 domain-containing protein [bacterium]
MNDRAFFREVAARLRCDERRAEAITYVVFQELRARITPKEASNVAAQLPTGLKKLWLENERDDRPVERLHLPEFIGRVRQHAALPDDAEAQRGTRAVFAVLQHLLGSPSGTEGEAWDVFSQLPKDLKRLWLDASRAP